MKTLKRMMSGALAVLLLVCLMAVPASAAGYTITISGTSNSHAYVAYQIFKGDLDGKVLSNITWGSGVKQDDTSMTKLMKELDEDATIGDKFTASMTAAQVAKELSSYATNTEPVDVFARIVGKYLSSPSGTYTYADSKHTITDLDAGYYLVMDSNEISGNDASTKYLLKVVANTEATVKSSVPTVEKGVSYVKDQTYVDATDVGIGDNVFFKLVGGLPSHYKDYQQYYYSFEDTMDFVDSKVAFSNITVTDVYVLHSISGDVETITKIKRDGEYGLNVDTSAQNIVKFTFKDLKKIVKEEGSEQITLNASDKIVIKYKATLNENAEIGNNTQDSLAGNQNKVKLIFANDPTQPSGTAVDDVEKGETETDNCAVFTYQLEVTKKDEASNAVLSGAQFVLAHADTNKYAHIKDGKIVKWVAYDSPDAAKAAEPTDGETTLLTSGADGIVLVQGLDQGSYDLTEVTAPSSYNKLSASIRVNINATINQASRTITALTVTHGTTVDGDLETGKVGIVVYNTQGSTLPETGGIGTTIFYVVGIVLVAGAATVLFAKKRTERN